MNSLSTHSLTGVVRVFDERSCDGCGPLKSWVGRVSGDGC